MKKRFLGLVLAVLFCFSLMLPASATSVAERAVPELEVMSTSSTAPISTKEAVRAAAAGYISGGYGELTCTLGRYISKGYIQAFVSSSNASGNVSCGVVLPNGAYQHLGSVPALGGSTAKIPFYTLESGTYTFIFEPSTTAQLNVSGYIYEE